MPRVVLVVLDGFGERPETEGNAIRLARMPTLRADLRDAIRWTLIGASGNDVGLPDGQMGNSEVGHLNLGAGRIVYQDIVRIDKAIKDGAFFENQTLVATVEAAKASAAARCTSSASPARATSTPRWSTPTRCASWRSGAASRSVAWHAFLDGRDTPPEVGGRLPARRRQASWRRSASASWSSAVGRYYAMDRDKRWDRARGGLEDADARRGQAGRRSGAAPSRRGYEARRGSRSPTSS